MAPNKVIWDGFYIRDPINNQDEEGQYQMNGVICNLVLTELDLNYDGNGLVKGSGHQEVNNDNGNTVNFIINGQHNSNTHVLSFTKTQNNLNTYFTGEIDGNSIQGSWKDTQNGENCGSFRLNRVILKPGWNGYYVQFNHFYMNFENFHIERVHQGKVTGSGKDQVGDFVIQGVFHENLNKVDFVKQYIGQHAIYYSGILEGKVLRGHWGFSAGHPQDKFKLEFYE